MDINAVLKVGFEQYEKGDLTGDCLQSYFCGAMNAFLTIGADKQSLINALAQYASVPTVASLIKPKQSDNAPNSKLDYLINNLPDGVFIGLYKRPDKIHIAHGSKFFIMMLNDNYNAKNALSLLVNKEGNHWLSCKDSYGKELLSDIKAIKGTDIKLVFNENDKAWLLYHHGVLVHTFTQGKVFGGVSKEIASLLQSNNTTKPFTTPPKANNGAPCNQNFKFYFKDEPEKVYGYIVNYEFDTVHDEIIFNIAGKQYFKYACNEDLFEEYPFCFVDISDDNDKGGIIYAESMAGEPLQDVLGFTQYGQLKPISRLVIEGLNSHKPKQSDNAPNRIT
jgi:hypothetical protein